MSAGSKCTLFNVFLVPEPPDLLMGEPRLSDYPVRAEVDDNATTALGRRLMPNVWPPPAVSWTPSEAHCPTLSFKANFPAAYPYGTGGDLSMDASWRAAIANQLNYDPSATPAEHARVMCTSSALCMVGYAIGSGMIFKPDFWTSSAFIAQEMGKLLANNFGATMTAATQQSTWNELDRTRRATRCRGRYSWATCLGLTSVIDGMTAGGSFT